MSTAYAMPTAAGPERILHVVPDSKEQFSIVLSAQRLLREGKDRMFRTSRKAWTWARESFLDKTYALLKSAAMWVMDKAQWIGGYLGKAGAAGLGLLAVTTKSGRWVLSNTIGRVWGWFKKASSFIFDTTLNVLDRLGTPGRWVADRLIDVADFGTRMTNRIKAFNTKHIASHFALDSKAMAAGQVAGVWLAARQALSLLTFTPLRYVIMVGAAIFTLFKVPVPERMSKWYGEKFPSQSAKAAQEADAAHAASVGDAMADGVVTEQVKAEGSYQAAVDQAAKVIAEAPEPATPGNRAERRAAQREAAREAREAKANGSAKDEVVADEGVQSDVAAS